MKLTSRSDNLIVPDITLEQVEQTVRDLARAYPDAIYQGNGVGCCYLTGIGGPGNGCIIGQALRSLGCVFREKTGLFVHELFYELDSSSWLSTVQGLQDENVAWGRAVELADKYGLDEALRVQSSE